MPVCWVWNNGKELCIPACSARLARPTGLALASDCWAIPILSGQRQRAVMCTGCSPYWQCLSSCAHSVPGSGTAHCGQHLVRDHTCVGQQRQCKSRVQDLWPVIVEAYRLGNATTRLGSLTLSMLTDPSRPRQVFPLLKATAKETEWFCRALTFVLPHFSDLCHRHISRV